MPRINKSQYAILGCLSIRPMSAYEIRQFIKKSITYFWSESEGQLYPTLKRLAEENWVEYREEPAAKSGTKKIYSMTEHGEAALVAWLAKGVDPSPYRNELLLKLFFGSNQPVITNKRLLVEQLRESETVREILLSIKGSLVEKQHLKHRLPYIEITLDYGIDILTAEIAWCQQSIKKLSNL